MVIVESELTQLLKDTEAELEKVGNHRTKLKKLLSRITTIQLTPRTEVTPAVAAIPAEMEKDEITIKTPAIPAVPETTKKIFDVQPIDKNLGEIPMDDARRQQILDNIMSKKAALEF